MPLLVTLSQLYPSLIGIVGVGILLGKKLPETVPGYLGKFLYYLGIPLSIIAFLQQANLSGKVWVAPFVAWAAIGLGWGLAWLWVKDRNWTGSTKGSFILAAMVGNTGYIGYPVTLSLAGENYFAWALFYDLLGTLIGSFGLGIVIASRMGTGSSQQWWWDLLKNPALWSLVVGLGLRLLILPSWLIEGLRTIGWSMIGAALLLIGMRLATVQSWRALDRAVWCVAIKMIVVPLVMTGVLSCLGLGGVPRQVMILQMAMPPAFATMVIAEVYELDRELTVTALALGTILLLFTLPIWIWLCKS